MSCSNCACDKPATTATDVDPAQVMADNINKNFKALNDRIDELFDLYDEQGTDLNAINEFLSHKHEELKYGDISITATHWSARRAEQRAIEHRLNMAKYLLEQNGYQVEVKPKTELEKVQAINDSRTISN